MARPQFPRTGELDRAAIVALARDGYQVVIGERGWDAWLVKPGMTRLKVKVSQIARIVIDGDLVKVADRTFEAAPLKVKK